MFSGIVLAGGKGSRLRPVAPVKVLAPVEGDRLLLDYSLQALLASGASEIVVVTNLENGGAEIKEHVQRRYSKANAPVKVVFETSAKGTVEALSLGLRSISSDHFVCSFGDLFVNESIRRLAEHQMKNASTPMSVLVKHTDHPEDSDLIIEGSRGTAYWIGRTKDRPVTEPILGLTGIFSGHRRKSLELLANNVWGDVGRDFFPAVVQSTNVGVIRALGAVLDAGTPERLNQVREKPPAEPEFTGIDFFDRDGTLIQDKSPHGLTSVSDVQILEERIDFLTQSGFFQGLNVMVSNQPAIAKGLVGEAEFCKIQTTVERELLSRGVRFFRTLFCPHHPESGHRGEVKKLKIECTCRKPGTQMYERALREFGFSSRNSRSVGNSDVDKLAAEKIGLQYVGVSNIN